MYQRSYRSYPGGHRQNGQRRIRTFNPTALCQKVTGVEKEEEYKAKNSFSGFAISDSLKRNISARGYKTPTPIQDQAIPELLNGRDLIGVADTGTGKTAAFLIPLIDKALKNSRERILILTPTRELATQIEKEFRIFAGNLGVYSVVCVGGLAIHNQIRMLRRGPQFVIGTPGRLRDLEDRRELNFNSFTSIVLDEVDRMLDMGFLGEIEYISKKLPQNRQSLFFSATTTPNVQRIMAQMVRSPVVISIKSKNTISNINQEIVKTNGRPKIEVLDGLLRRDGFTKVLVFGRTKRNVENLARDLGRKGIRAGSIHGNKSQNQRFRALDDFKHGSVQVLIATDVASRGIDVNDITHVINYDLPESHEVYIHRIGRTGRANKSGYALTFVD